jgi:hypothetical protein
LREEEAALVSFVATKSFLFLEKKKSRSAPADKRFSIDEASSVIRRARGRTIQEKKRKDENTHHTPTQEYVVPKSIPIAGPSDLDIFFLLCVCVVIFV